MKWDGHTHTPFCPHGSDDPLEAYIEAAIDKGFQIYSITEHAPLPESFVDPVPHQDSALAREDIEQYLDECHQIKAKYEAYIQIKVGLEVDYLLGYERETTAFLDKYGPRLDDAILSVHFIPIGEEWVCLDYSPDSFQVLLEHFGSSDLVYQSYYRLMFQAIKADLGVYKPTRIGHFSLIEKFKKKYPSLQKDIWWQDALLVLTEIKKRGYQLDFNTAGLIKPLCQDIYPSQELFEVALNMQIPFVFGSDAHQAKLVGYAYEEFLKRCL